MDTKTAIFVARRLGDSLRFRNTPILASAAEDARHVGMLVRAALNFGSRAFLHIRADPHSYWHESEKRRRLICGAGTFSFRTDLVKVSLSVDELQSVVTQPAQPPQNTMPIFCITPDEFEQLCQQHDGLVDTRNWKDLHHSRESPEAPICLIEDTGSFFLEPVAVAGVALHRSVIGQHSISLESRREDKRPLVIPVCVGWTHASNVAAVLQMARSLSLPAILLLHTERCMKTEVNVHVKGTCAKVRSACGGELWRHRHMCSGPLDDRQLSRIVDTIRHVNTDSVDDIYNSVDSAFVERLQRHGTQVLQSTTADFVRALEQNAAAGAVLVETVEGWAQPLHQVSTQRPVQFCLVGAESRGTPRHFVQQLRRLSSSTLHLCCTHSHRTDARTFGRTGALVYLMALHS
ncbi:MAG: hypothetical protein MHM6MM_005749 [Cercozoa sp. M6MM]